MNCYNNTLAGLWVLKATIPTNISVILHLASQSFFQGWYSLVQSYYTLNQAEASQSYISVGKNRCFTNTPTILLLLLFSWSLDQQCCLSSILGAYAPKSDASLNIREYQALCTRKHFIWVRYQLFSDLASQSYFQGWFRALLLYDPAIVLGTALKPHQAEGYFSSLLAFIAKDKEKKPLEIQLFWFSSASLWLQQ